MDFGRILSYFLEILINYHFTGTKKFISLAEEGRFIFPIIKYCNFDYMKEQNLFTGWSVSRGFRVDIQVPELIKVSSQFIYLDCFKSMKTSYLLDMLW